MKKFLIIISLIFFYGCSDSEEENCLTALQLVDLDCPTQDIQQSCEPYACNIFFPTSVFSPSLELDFIEIPVEDENCSIDSCFEISCENGDSWGFAQINPLGELQGNFSSGIRNGVGDLTCEPTNPDLIVQLPELDTIPPLPDDCTIIPEVSTDCPAEGLTMLCPFQTDPPTNVTRRCEYINQITEEVASGFVEYSECEAIDCFTLNCELKSFNITKTIEFSSDATFFIEDFLVFSEADFAGTAIIDGESGFEGACGIGF